MIDNIVAWVDQTAKRVDAIMKQRIIAALLMLFQGVSLVTNPGPATEGMAKGIALAVAIAAVTILVDAVKNRQTGWLPASLITLTVLGFCVYFYFQPAWLAHSLRYIIGLYVLSAGALQLFQTLRLRCLTDMEKNLRERMEQGVAQANERIEVANKANDILKEEVGKKLKATFDVFTWIKRGNVASWAVGGLMTALGVFILAYPMEGNAVVTRISAVAMIVMALTTLGDAARLWIRQHRSASTQGGK